MRTEMKLAIFLFATNSMLAHLIALPLFVSGLLIGLSIYFIIIGIIPKKAYFKFKTMQAKKFSIIRKIAGVF